MQTAKDKLSSYIEALRPIIYINHFDFQAVDELILKTSDGGKIFEFNNAYGEISFDGKHAKKDIDILAFLSAFDSDIKLHPSLLILKDIHNHLENPKVIASLKSIAFKRMYQDDFNVTIFIVSTRLVIPVELEKLITIFDIPLPDQDEIEKIIRDYVKSFKMNIIDKVVDELKLSFKGLSAFEIEQILNC